MTCGDADDLESGAVNSFFCSGKSETGVVTLGTHGIPCTT